jgi:acetoin utilization deacetylase AcuC-like enzyme
MAEVHYVYQPDSGIDIGPHVFPTEKYGLVARSLRDDLGVEETRFHTWAAVTDEDVERVHTGSYVEDLRLARPTWATLSSELPVTREVIEAFRAMVGGSIAAVGLALRHGVGFHIGGGFHHAFPDHAEGFCYLHDMAIAVERFRAQGALDKVLFVDVDLHQGNGTAAVYRADPNTYTYSIHQENNYPLKQRSDLDRGLGDGVGDQEYLDWLQNDLQVIDRQFQPQLVCYVAGVDPFFGDQLGGLALSEQGLRHRDQLVLSRFVGRGVPVAVFLAGGYAPTPEQTARLHVGTARAAENACSAGSQGSSEA